MESPGELGLAWVWEEGGSSADCSQEEPQELSPCVTPFFWQPQPAWPSSAVKKAEQAPGLVLPPETA